MSTLEEFLVAADATGRVNAYTDGSCGTNSRGVGGWGVVLISGLTRFEVAGADPVATNNRMELFAAIIALEVSPRAVPLRVYTDATYLQKGASLWLPKWKCRGWVTGRRMNFGRPDRNGIRKRTMAGSPIANVDLWKRIDKLQEGRPVEWFWIRGHNGNGFNNEADALAVSARLNFLRAST